MSIHREAIQGLCIGERVLYTTHETVVIVQVRKSRQRFAKAEADDYSLRQIFINANFDGIVKSQKSSHSCESRNPVVPSLYGFLLSQE